jgi:outer membrane protein assembly complex protein YaeT
VSNRAPARRAPSVLAGWLAAATVALAAPPAAGAQDIYCDPGDTEVRALRFSGNSAFSDDILARGIVTEASSLLRRRLGVVGSRRCLDENQFRLDVARLILFYRRSGFFQVQVDTIVQRPSPLTIEVEFTIQEGPALVLDSLDFTGLDAVADSRRLTSQLPIQVGDRFDQYKLDSARVAIERRLRNRGYPQAQVERSFTVDTAARSAHAVLHATPGPLTRIARVDVEVTPRVGTEQQMSENTVRRLLGVRDGALYNERQLVQGQRDLYLTDAFERVEIGLDSGSIRGFADSSVGIIVRVAEAPMHTARLGLGYGTLDCLRTQAEYTNVNFLGGARRLEVAGRVSKIGIGAPGDFAPELCFPQIREDPYSDTLNYYIGATFRQPRLLGLRTPPAITLYSERRSEYRAYLRNTPIAFSLSRVWPNGLGSELPVTGVYSMEYGRTHAQPAFFCAVFNLCSEADRSRVQRNQRLAVLSLAAERGRTDNPVNPSRGTVARLDWRHSSVAVGSESGQGFNVIQGSLAAYRSIAPEWILAARVRLGVLLGSAFTAVSDDFVPPQERLYGGGPNSVRGFRQNELGPIVYLARGYVAVDTVLGGGETVTYLRASPGNDYDRTVPTGGNAAVVGNLELRFPSPILRDLIQLTAFMDVGEVWNRGSSSFNLGFDQLKWTPGVGMRARSPVGPIRFDIGYNPYELQRGVAYFDEALTGSVAPLYCVSPGNRIPATVVDVVNGRPIYEQAGGTCPASFQPESRGGFLRNLTFHFSIGQAF